MPDVTPTNPPAEPAASNTAAEQTAEQVAQQAASNLNPDTMSPRDLVELINALPDKIVDAIREATVTKQGSEAKPPAEVVSQGKFFGYPSFAAWWVGNRNLENSQH